MNDRLEKHLLDEILRELDKYEILFWRHTVRSPFIFNKRGKGGFAQLGSHEKRGLPDILAIWKGQFIGIEVKTILGRQSLYQKVFQIECQNFGGLYVVIRDLDELQKLMETLGVKKGVA